MKKTLCLILFLAGCQLTNPGYNEPKASIPEGCRSKREMAAELFSKLGKFRENSAIVQKHYDMMNLPMAFSELDVACRDFAELERLWGEFEQCYPDVENMFDDKEAVQFKSACVFWTNVPMPLPFAEVK